MSDENFQCTVASSKNKLFDNSVLSVVFNTSSGEVQVLPQHAEAYFLIEKGPIKLEVSSNKFKEININEGVCFIKDNKVIVLTPGQPEEN